MLSGQSQLPCCTAVGLCAGLPPTANNSSCGHQLQPLHLCTRRAEPSVLLLLLGCLCCVCCCLHLCLLLVQAAGEEALHHTLQIGQGRVRTCLLLEDGEEVQGPELLGCFSSL